MTPIDRRRLEHAAALADWCESGLRHGGTVAPDVFRQIAESIRAALAPEIGDSLVADLAASGGQPMPDADAASLAEMIGGTVWDDATTILTERGEPFRVLGSCPPPPVNLIDGETA